MANEIRLPKLGQTMEEGTVVRCLVNVGDAVKRDQVIFEIETDKATMEMESPVDGFVKNILVNVSQILPVNDLMMIIGGKDEQVPQSYIDGLLKGSITDAVEQTASESGKAAPVAAQAASPASAKIVDLQKLGQTMEEGTIVNCHVKVGDEVKREQVIFEIETDKATMEMESPVSGFVKAMLVEVGQTVPVGSPLLVVADKDDVVPQSYIDALKGGQSAAVSSVQQLAPAVTASAPSPVASTTAVETAGRVFVSPRAKMAAKEMGVTLAGISGTGPGGRIIEKDVRGSAAVGQHKPAMTPVAGPQAGSEVALTKMRRAIGSNLQRSWQQSPHFNVTMSINMTRAMSFREQYNHNKQKPQQVSVNDLVVKACAVALKQYPAVNSKLAEDKIVYHAAVNIGIAAAVAEGLVVPVLVDADKLSWDQLQAQTKQMVAEARSGKIVGMGKGTFTISNLGMFGVDHFTAIVNPPECAILAVGAVIDTVVAINKMIAVAPMMQVTLCSDHRIIDGATAAQFLKSLREYLEEKVE